MLEKQSVAQSDSGLRDKRIVMLGTDPSGKGGIASVVAVYKAHGLFDEFDIRYVVTHREGGAVQKIACAVWGGLQLLLLLLGGRIAAVHAQVASYGSFKRKAFYLGMARAFGVPTIFHLHGAEFKKFTDQVASPALRRRIVSTLQRSTEVIALSESWAEYLRGIAPGVRVRAIANPVFMPDQLDRSREEPGRVLFLGRADQRKGVFDLLTAFAQVRAKRPEARLVIGGDGDLAKVAARLAELGLEDCVSVLGWVSGDAKATELARAQIFVLPSYDEGLPMAMLESMASGKAIVVTPVGGIPEAVQNGEQGLLVTPGKPEELAKALLELIESAELRARLSAGARQRVAERFCTSHVLGQVGQLYRELGLTPVSGN